MYELENISLEVQNVKKKFLNLFIKLSYCSLTKIWTNSRSHSLNMKWVGCYETWWNSVGCMLIVMQSPENEWRISIPTNLIYCTAKPTSSLSTPVCCIRYTCIWLVRGFAWPFFRMGNTISSIINSSGFRAIFHCNFYSHFVVFSVQAICSFSKLCKERGLCKVNSVSYKNSAH